MFLKDLRLLWSHGKLTEFEAFGCKSCPQGLLSQRFANIATSFIGNTFIVGTEVLVDTESSKLCKIMFLFAFFNDSIDFIRSHWKIIQRKEQLGFVRGHYTTTKIKKPHPLISPVSVIALLLS